MDKIPSKQECLDRFREYFTSHADDPRLIESFYDWLMIQINKVEDPKNG